MSAFAAPRSALLICVVATMGCSASGREAAWQQRTAGDTGFCSAAYQARFGWPDPEKAASVCSCESRGNPRAVSKTGRYLGLFQFSRSTWNAVGGGEPFDPATNSENAYRLFLRRGWRPWPVCSR